MGSFSRGEFPEAVLSDTHAFELTFAKPQDNYLRLAMKGGGKKALYPLNCRKMLSGKEGLSVICKKSVNYLKRKMRSGQYWQIPEHF